jgi:hypothetical protein
MLKKLVRRSAIAAIVLSGTFGASSIASAQCSNGSCGNVGYADAFGGYGSAPFGSQIRNPVYAANGGYGYWGHRQVQPMFDNYFTHGAANQADAALYVSPVGVPGWVGHTYIPYEPLRPDEFLYQHKDRYHSYYDGGVGLNRTKAKYWAPPIHTAAQKIYHKIELPR